MNLSHSNVVSKNRMRSLVSIANWSKLILRVERGFEDDWLNRILREHRDLEYDWSKVNLRKGKR